MYAMVYRQNKDGEEEKIAINLTSDEVSFFVEYAVNDLVKKGILSTKLMEFKVEEMHKA